MSATSQSRSRGFGSRITLHASPFTICLLLALATFNAVAYGTFTLEAGSVSDIDNARNVTFTLQFSRAPDFVPLDAYERQADAFQFFIATSTNIPLYYPPRPYASLIRGGEINFDNAIVIRNDGPPDDNDPHSGGWGSIRGSVPYTLNANILTFSAPADVLNVQGPFANILTFSAPADVLNV